MSAMLANRLTLHAPSISFAKLYIVMSQLSSRISSSEPRATGMSQSRTTAGLGFWGKSLRSSVLASSSRTDVSE